MHAQRTVRVRIAVVVNEDGNWSSAGYPEMTEADRNEVFNHLTDGLIRQLHFLEAVVPLPSPATLSAQLVEPDQAKAPKAGGQHEA